MTNLNKTTTISKATKSTNKQNGGNKMIKEVNKIRVYEAAALLGVSSQEMMLLAGKDHWFCSISAAEFFNIKDELNTTKNQGGKTMKYLLNITRNDSNKEVPEIQKKAYNQLSKLVGFEGADITFAFTKIKGNNFFKEAMNYTKLIDEDGEYSIKIFEYEDTCKDVNIHNGEAWTEMACNYKSFLEALRISKEVGGLDNLIDDYQRSTLMWAEEIVKPVNDDSFKEAIFVTNSKEVRLVAEEIVSASEAEETINKLAKWYGLSEEEPEPMAHELSLEDGQWDMLKAYLYMDDHGFIHSKKTGKMLTLNELMISLEWVARRRG